MSAPLSVCVVGLGYTGLPTAVVLAVNGVHVRGVDINQRSVDAINAGEVPFVEHGLAEALKSARGLGTLVADATPAAADAYIVAVPTPFLADRQPDLSYVKAATTSIAPFVRDDSLVILESTSPPGTARRIAGWISELRPDIERGGKTVHVAYCPERVLPGRIMTEMVRNDRIIGGLTTEAAQRARAVYATFCEGELLVTDAITAEMAKLVENSFRDVNIAFANEISLICEKVGVNVWELIRLANHHPRVDILQPGPGVGGHCIAVDPWFLVSTDPENANLIRTAREVNDRKPAHVIDQIADAVSAKTSPRIAILGLAFKPDIDDLRGSPAREITRTLATRFPSATVMAVEPNIAELPRDLAELPNVRLTSLDDAVRDADCVALLVNHREFSERPDVHGGTILIDTRGAWSAL